MPKTNSGEPGVWIIVIPDWSEGCPLTITGIKADTEDDARRHVVEWVNRRAGYHYCDNLPRGTVVCRGINDSEPVRT